MTQADLDALRRQLLLHEGLRLKPYLDTVGKWTIGCGRNLTDKGISHAEADFMLETDLAEVLADLRTFPWFASLDGVRQRVVADLRFNLGPTGFRKFTNTLAEIAAGNYMRAAANLRKSKWYGQVKSRGVRLVQMMETGRDV